MDASMKTAARGAANVPDGLTKSKEVPMPTATQTLTTPTRRSALGFSVAGFTTPALAGAAKPDAEVIALCAEFHRQHEVAMALPDHDEDGLDAALGVRHDISDQILGIPAKTQAGQKAKALVALVLIEENQPLDRMDGDMSFAYEALRDVAGDFA
jgi:hypothetical protein